MRRLLSVLLLGIFAMPYASAPLCRAGAHDHPSEHEAHAATEAHAAHAATEAHSPDTSHRTDVASWTGLDTGVDCHERMRCSAVVDLAAGISLVDRYAPLPIDARTPLTASDVSALATAPELPPPELG